MRSILLLLFSLLISVSISNCKDPPFDRVYSFWVKNDSKEAIAFLVSYNYPDTIIPDTYNKLKGVQPGSKSPYDSKEKWEKVFDDLPADTLSIFLFSEQTLAIYDWQIVRNDYKIIIRYDLSYDDLENMNWTITYP